MHLYVHVPYCAAKCPYCDFNSIAGRNEEFAVYVEALLNELRCVPHGPYTTVFIGGGTPSILPPQLLARLCHGIRDHCSLADDYEWTMEANPGSADGERFRIAAEHGVNRLSIGVQSLYDHHLRTLGRVHGAAEAQAVVACAQSIVPKVSADMMIGLPMQTMEEVAAEVAWYGANGLQHASIYHLAYEPGTEFHALRQRGVMNEIDPELSAQMLELVESSLADHGLFPYETSNYASEGHSCQHNLAYWLQHDYWAVGAGAVSTIGGLRCTREPHPGRYIDAINQRGQASWKEERLSPQDMLTECWMLGLRLHRGVSEQRLTALGDDMQRWSPIAENLIGYGLLERAAGYLRLTSSGRRVQDAVTVELLPGPSWMDAHSRDRKSQI